MQQTTTQQNITDILEDSFDFSTSSPEEKQAKLQEATKMITESALLHALDTGTEEAREAFRTLTETNTLNETSLITFIQKYIPDFEQHLKRELEHFLKQEDGVSQ